MTFICYPKCSTCKKAQKFLDDNKLSYQLQDIVQDTPSFEHLKAWHTKTGLPIRRLFNTSGMRYRELDLKNKLDSMSDDEAFSLLASDSMLIKRPLLVGDDLVLIGFKEKEWTENLL